MGERENERGREGETQGSNCNMKNPRSMSGGAHTVAAGWELMLVRILKLFKLYELLTFG